MLRKIFNWFGFNSSPSKTTLLQQLDDIKRSHAEISELVSQLQHIVADQANKIQEQEQKKTSVTPWVCIESSDFDDVKGIQLRLDWNDAFIQSLKDAGLKGRTEEELVERWLAYTADNVAQDIREDVINNTDITTVTRDFE